MDRDQANAILRAMLDKYPFTREEGLALSLCVVPGNKCTCVGADIVHRRMTEINEVENGRNA
jgi:hypothetical protein